MKKIIFSLAIVVSLLSACTQNKTDKHNASEADSHEEVSLKLTAYNSDYEVFAEAVPFVVGKTSRVLSHFTHLPGFNAVISGSITIRLVIEGKEVSQKLTQPTRKGIYAFEITPGTPGKGRIIYDIVNGNGTSQLLVSDITVFTKEEDADKAAEAAVKTSPFAAVFTKEQSWKIDFATDMPKSEPFGQVIKTTAQVQSAQGDEILVSAKTSGMLMFSSGNVTEGKSVSTGQVLFTVSGSGMAENNSTVRFQEAQNNYDKAKADYERMKALANDKIVSDKDLIAAKNLYENTKAVYDNLNNNFSAKGQNVSSPMSGFVKQLFVQNGQFVEAGQPIVSISQNKTLVLQAEVQQKYAQILGNITNANIRTMHNNQAYTLAELNGKVLSYGRNTSDDNYLIPVSLQIDNKGSFIAGGFVELYLKTTTNTQALTVPNEALLEEQGNYFVYVQIHPELFEKREVHPGATDGLRTEILKGLSESERIVIKGAVMIKLAQATGTLDAHSGHVH
ncbi:MAG: efflux RND transporter periplasmic adaptor subunit [Bacteroidales bacterium]|nr:efflux RND transporter periplasmic adaptor subunit [Bacteroidales bacterium]